ncbi:hypothetical protein ADT26_07200 [Xanthomonas oryzae]|nr:hypothetical protein AXO1947_06745 [Xanthomonas oryzae pv. oryzae]KOR45484.1 hypothetical protein ADT26_07200 [Xanthomonas oryzae]AUI91164.1 hypothetical protein BVV16_14985 [Xanthomonas oryzae pv. oryzae]AUI94836.1 hypothetical protein BVV17_14990 [Xanthomonas oryzae pv. oryzae]AUI98509.1 hypothetical protein BVV18_14995 [Xanthomonas oryzae pv. oryzae]
MPWQARMVHRFERWAHARSAIRWAAQSAVARCYRCAVRRIDMSVAHVCMRMRMRLARSQTPL